MTATSRILLAACLVAATAALVPTASAITGLDIPALNILVGGTLVSTEDSISIGPAATPDHALVDTAKIELPTAEDAPVAAAAPGGDPAAPAAPGGSTGTAPADAVVDADPAADAGAPGNPALRAIGILVMVLGLALVLIWVVTRVIAGSANRRAKRAA